ncbi:MAG: insulinase family protein [Chitinophagaceae bacterium]|nr:insulinase family protein [Chitinophagaceae bacterium]MCB9045781.1 insulinase family protein [Chitinophagales bacterium]
MKKLSLFILTVALAINASAQQYQVATVTGTKKGDLDRSVRPKPGPAPEIKLGKTESFVLPNGLKVFVVENHKLPLVSASIQLDIYPEMEGEMAGYSTFLSELLTAGTKTRSKDQLNKEIDFIGARINANSRGMFGQSLKKHQNTLLELMSDIAMNADFKQDEVEKVKKRTLSGLQASKNEPDDMLNNVTSVLNYGANHPYGEVPNEKTVDNVTLAKCNEYYKTYYRPNVAYMAVVGDVTLKEVKPLIEKYFGAWQKGEVPVTKYPNPAAPTTTQVALVPRPEAVQSVINVTYPIDLLPGSPDVVKAKVTNAILGGGSMGRLFMNLREKHAWTYGSYSSISQDELKGNFTAYAKCRNAVTDSSVAEILAEMKRMNDEKISNEALQDQIKYMSGGFAIGLESPQTVAQYAINIERYNMPKDYYTNYLKNLSAVTPEDVQMIAKKYIHPDKAHIIVVGSKDDVAKGLERFDADGKLDLYDNYGNPFKETVAKAAPDGMNAATVMKNYIRAIGGEKTIKSIKDIKTVSKGTFAVAGQEIPITITEMKKAPLNYNVKIEGMGMVLQKQVFDGTKGYMEAGGQKKELSGDDLVRAKQEADIYADLTPEKYGITRELKGMETVNGKEAYKLEVSDNGKKTTEYYDTQTGYLIQTVSAEEGTTDLSDYKDAGNGYFIPHKLVTNVQGQTITANVESVEINKGIDNSNFQ